MKQLKSINMYSIIILGMHRSGTSCLTGCLEQLGLNLGEVSDFNDYNLKGNKEDESISALNEQLLRYNGGCWRDPPVQIEWTIEHERMRDRILKTYAKLPSPIGMKDPRMLFTLPFWQQELPPFFLLGSFRHPLNVAQSLYARKNLRIEMSEGLNLWHRYNQKLLDLTKQQAFDLVNFDMPADAYLADVLHKAQKLGLRKQTQTLDFFDRSLRNQDSTDNVRLTCPDTQLDLYHELLRISQDTSIQPTKIIQHV